MYINELFDDLINKGGYRILKYVGFTKPEGYGFGFREVTMSRIPGTYLLKDDNDVNIIVKYYGEEVLIKLPLKNKRLLYIVLAEEEKGSKG
jgi:hypothetical protein